MIREYRIRHGTLHVKIKENRKDKFFLFFYFFFIFFIFFFLKGDRMHKTKRRLELIGRVKDELNEVGWYRKHHQEQLQTIERLESRLTDISSPVISDLPKTPADPKAGQGKLARYVDEKNKLLEDLLEGKVLNDLYSAYLESLPKMDRDIVETLWIRHEQGGAAYLAERYGYSIPRIYSVSTSILSKFARLRFGKLSQEK